MFNSVQSCYNFSCHRMRIAVGGVSGAAVGFGTGYYIGKKAKEAVETRKCTGKKKELH